MTRMFMLLSVLSPACHPKNRVTVKKNQSSTVIKCCRHSHNYCEQKKTYVKSTDRDEMLPSTAGEHGRRDE